MKLKVVTSRSIQKTRVTSEWYPTSHFPSVWMQRKCECKSVRILGLSTFTKCFGLQNPLDFSVLRWAPHCHYLRYFHLRLNSSTGHCNFQLRFVSMTKAKYYIIVNDMSKNNLFLTSKHCKSERNSAFACVCTKVWEEKVAYTGIIWDQTGFWHAGWAQLSFVVYIRWIWPVRVESSPDWSLWEFCQGFQQDQDFNSILYMKNISVSSDLWGEHIWNTSEDTWRRESRVNPSNMRTSSCASSFQLCLVSSFAC